MRNPSFVAQHRGGPLTAEQHRALMTWAFDCILHAAQTLGTTLNPDLMPLMAIGRSWQGGLVKVGAAQKASLAAHAIARATEDPIAKALARAVGQAVATAHMADHALGAPYYIQKAFKSANLDDTAEMLWQNEQLPATICDLVREARNS